MSEKQRPIAKLKFWCKQEKREYEVASVWPNDRFDWKHNVSPEKQARDGEYPRMALSEAARRAEAGEGFLSYCKAKQNAPKQDRPQQKRTDVHVEFDTSDGDIPF